MKTLKAIALWGTIVAAAVMAAVLFGGPSHSLLALDPQHALTLAGGGFIVGSTLATKWPNLLDVANRLDPNGNVATVVEILAPVEEILDDVPFFECNDGTAHVTTIRTGIPEPTFRKLYGGIQPQKSTTAKVRHGTGMAESYAEIDKALADLNGNTAAFRLSEEKPFIQGFAKKISRTLFYGNEKTASEEFTGLASFFNDLDAESGDNIIDGGGSGSDNTSIWLVGWSQETCHGLYPKGSKAGLSITDKGQVTIEDVDGNGGRMEAYRTHYRWDAGLALRNWKSVVRIANIDISELDTLANTKNLITWMIEATERVDVPDASMRLAFYCNRKIRTKLRLAILEKIGSNLTWETVAGKRVMMFDEIPVRRCDQILSSEAQVT